MRLHILAIGAKMPNWIDAGFTEYAQRMPRELSLHLQALAAPARSRSLDRSSLRRREAELLRAAVPTQSWMVALDEQGQSVDTPSLAKRLQHWQHSGRDVALLIGGAEGLDDTLRQQADWVWSLSPLTFPHLLVRVLVAEQLYRAWTLLNHHPYHRA